jgi:hypothetical protein
MSSCLLLGNDGGSLLKLGFLRCAKYTNERIEMILVEHYAPVALPSGDFHNHLCTYTWQLKDTRACDGRCLVITKLLWMTDWLIYMFWLADRWTDRQTDWLTHGLNNWLAGALIDWTEYLGWTWDWRTVKLVDSLTDAMKKWLIIWLTYWLTGSHGHSVGYFLSRWWLFN